MLSLFNKSVLAIFLLETSRLVFAHPTYYYEEAPVVRVEPIAERSHYSVPHEECWYEQVPEHHYHSTSATGTVLGGVIGGVVGNQFGKGNGKIAMTIAGGLLGASLGHDWSDDSGYSYTTYENRRHCRVVHSGYGEERITGYRVHYRYKGRRFVTYTKEYPGPTIPVEADMRPCYRATVC